MDCLTKSHTKILIFLILTSAAANLCGQSKSAKGDKLAKVLSQAESPAPFRSIDDQTVGASKNSLLSALSELESQLMRSGLAGANAWKSYLKWSELQAEINSEKPSRSKLLEIASLFQKNHPGLELTVFRDVRQAIVKFANTSYFSNDAVAKRIYDSRIGIIKRTAKELQSQLDDRKIALLGIAATDLENAHQCPLLVKTVRSAFAMPNFQLRVSEAFAQRVLSSQGTVDVRPVRETILGVLQCGTAQTTANISVNFLPNHQSGTFQVCIHGNTISDQVGTKEIGILGSIKICSQGHTSLVAQSNLYFDGNSINYSGVTANAKTSTRIKGVNTPPLIRGVVLNQINKQKPQGEAIASNLAKQKFVTSVTDKLVTAVGKANHAIAEKYKTPTRRLNFEPRGTSVSTSSDAVYIFSLVGNESQLGASETASVEHGHDIAVQIHESVINNALEHVLGGKTVTNDSLRQMIESFGAKVPPPSPDEKPLTIKFPRVRPVQVKFDKQRVSFLIAIDSLTQGSTRLKKIEISATYDVQAKQLIVKSTRSGEVKIDFTEGVGNFESGLAAVIEKKLKEIFKQKLDDIDLGSLELSPEVKAIGIPTIGHLIMDGGWISLGIDFRKFNNVASGQGSFRQSPTARNGAAVNRNTARIVVSPSTPNVLHISSN